MFVDIFAVQENALYPVLMINGDLSILACLRDLLRIKIHRRAAHRLTERQNARSILASEVADELGIYLKDIPEI